MARNNNKNSDTAIEQTEKELLEFWGTQDHQCIGYYHYDKVAKVYVIEDIRANDFRRLKYLYDEDTPIRITLQHAIRGIVGDDYYRFTWKLTHKNDENPHEIEIDSTTRPQRIAPKWFIETLFNKNTVYEDNILDTLSKQLSAKDSTFVYELLQNANDYPVKGQSVDVEFHITENYLLFMHTGEKFNVRNVSGICGINEKEKIENKKTIGYKGIGFKTVFLNNHYVYIRTGKYSFRFDKGELPNKNKVGKIRKMNSPYQILPIWTEHNEVADEVNDIFDNSDSDFRVQIAMRPDNNELLHKGKTCYRKLFQDVFKDSHIILFVPNINSVRVFINGAEVRSCSKNTNEWIVSIYEAEIEEELQELINTTIEAGNSRIPEKYKDFNTTRVSFACKHKGNLIQPIKDAHLYCYLPTTASWGLPFLMNTDMIPKGDRDDIEFNVALLDDQTNFNEELAGIAGAKLFDWIRDLLSSGQYDLGSIFSLIPDFQKCEQEHFYYDDYITTFANAFDDLVTTEPIIPVGNGELVPLADVLFDKTELSASGIMTDEEFLEFSGKEDYQLPIAELRGNEFFIAFLERYANQSYEKADLYDLIDNENFQDWIKAPTHNNNFLKYLLDRNFIEDFKDAYIFLREDGDIDAAENIYADVDKYIVDLNAFSDYLPRLSRSTRAFFSRNMVWSGVKDRLFKSFDPTEFVNKLLLSKENWGNTTNRLRVKSTSLGFYNFLSNCVGFSLKYKKLPVFDFTDNVIEDFNRTVSFYSKEGENLYKAAWTDCSWIHLISKDYSPKAKKYLKDNFGVTDFSVAVFIKSVLLSDEAKDFLSGLTDAHIDFVKFCFQNKNLLKKKDLDEYTLLTYDKVGNRVQVSCEEVVCFSSKLMDSYQEKAWIQNEWMYQLDNAYFNEVTKSNKAGFRQFLQLYFGVKEMTPEVFFNSVVAPHIGDICKNVSEIAAVDGGDIRTKVISEGIDILTYLGKSSDVAFRNKHCTEFLKLPMYCGNDVEVTDRKSCVFLYNADLENLLQADWAPDNFVYMLDQAYSDVFVKYPLLMKKLKVNQYTFKSIKKSLLSDGEVLLQCIQDESSNVAFHRFMCRQQESLCAEDYETIKEIPIYTVDVQGNPFVTIAPVVYVSDDYMEVQKGMEHFVKKYDSTAGFTSLVYLSDATSSSEKQLWKKYFIHLGIKGDIKSIIFNSVLPNLATIEETNLASLLSSYVEDFHKNNQWEHYVQILGKMRVATKGNGAFLPLCEVLFNNTTDTTEPFPYLTIENEISNDYLTIDVQKFLWNIVTTAHAADSNHFLSFSTEDEWKKAKVRWYLSVQEDSEKIAPFHVQFIRDLAADYIKNPAIYSDVNLKNILLLDQEQKYHPAVELVEGTAYEPRCKFEQYQMPMTFLSNDYLDEKQMNLRSLRKFIGFLGVVYDFREEHLPLMGGNYKFAVYFWSEYLVLQSNQKRFAEIKPETLNQYAIIPNSCGQQASEVKKPSELYAWELIKKGYVKDMIPDFEKKMPLKDIYSTQPVKDLLDKLDFATRLTFADCLECLLHTKKSELRRKILTWLPETVENPEIVKRYKNNPQSLWRNGRGSETMLKNLLVLSITENKLAQLFGKNKCVLSQEYMSDEGVFNRFCTIFGKHALSESDFQFKPKVYVDETNEMRKLLRLPLLIAAVISDQDTWETTYETCVEKLNELSFYNCNLISLYYSDELNDDNILYYRQDNAFYFVEDWMGRRVFKDMVKDMATYFDLADNIDSNILEAVFEANEKNQASIINRYVSYEIEQNDSFRAKVQALNKNVADTIQYTDEECQDEESVEDYDYGDPAQDEIEDSPEFDNSEGETADEGDDIPRYLSQNTAIEPNNLRSNRASVSDNESSDSYLLSPKEDVSSYHGEKSRDYAPGRRGHRQAPQPFSPEAVRSFGSHGEPWQLNVLEPTVSEKNALEHILGAGLTSAQIASQNYLVRLRLYHNLQENGYHPTANEHDFVSNNPAQHDYALADGKYIHACSAAGGIMYLSPAIWNKLADGRCIVCVYYGAKANEFLYFKSQDELLKKIGKDDILIKVTGGDKAEVVNSLYSGVLKDVTGTAYTLIRVKSNEKYTSIFEALSNLLEDENVDIDEC